MAKDKKKKAKGSQGTTDKKKKNKAEKEIKKATKEVAAALETKDHSKKEKAKSFNKEQVKAAEKVKEKALSKAKEEPKGLPKKVQDKMIVCKEKSKTKLVKVALSDITSTSKQIYVDNIHHANPQILHINYWVIMPNTRYVVATVTPEQYDEVVKALPKSNHLVSVVDCAVMPTLTYGSWTLKEVPNLPSLSQIAEEDVKLKKNLTRIHNDLIAIELYEEPTTEDTDDDDEDFDFDFNEDEDTDSADELDFEED